MLGAPGRKPMSDSRTHNTPTHTHTQTNTHTAPQRPKTLFVRPFHRGRICEIWHVDDTHEWPCERACANQIMRQINAWKTPRTQTGVRGDKERVVHDEWYLWRCAWLQTPQMESKMRIHQQKTHAHSIYNKNYHCSDSTCRNAVFVPPNLSAESRVSTPQPPHSTNLHFA